MSRAWLVLLVAIVATAGGALAADEPACGDEAPSCPAVDAGEGGGAGGAATTGVLIFFWGVGCPHCEEASPFVAELAAAHPSMTIERIEVRRDEAGRARFIAVARRLEMQAPGIPTFVYGDRYVIGYRRGVTDAAVRALIAGDTADATPAEGAEPMRFVDLPLVGTVDTHALSLPGFTVVIGLLDGINPCAMWVLLVLLGLLLHVRERRRMLLFGGVFVVMSGVVYFVFMTAWTGLFELVGFSREITTGLGIVILIMGLINLKELFWFKKGVSLVIPDKAKPRLYQRMRGIARAASLPAALAGIAALAFVVNLIELGCTLGLPAVYTRILSLRSDVSPAGRYAYLALYNVAYVVPLAIIVVVYVATLRRLTLSERGAKILKVVSGALLLLFGALFIAVPDILG